MRIKSALSGIALIAFTGTIIAEAGSAVVQAPFRAENCMPPNIAFGGNWMASAVLAYGSFPAQPEIYGKHADQVARETFENITRNNTAKIAACYTLPSNYLVSWLQSRTAKPL
jgi:hypothetical protein